MVGCDGCGFVAVMPGPVMPLLWHEEGIWLVKRFAPTTHRGFSRDPANPD